MKWDRETVEPAEFIFPPKTIRERDINGLVLRETVVKGIPAMSYHHVELVDQDHTVANAMQLSGGWSLTTRAREWPYKNEEYAFRLRKAEAMTRLTTIAAEYAR